ncbi:hypothetical protein [Gilvimarinus chinensis]|uniref:hypothetical protein n=1 Tax=Gilvimarinus chinensis TaxID=396005 RepID=UPI0003724CE0|nr:hypothetical protein [Gilvimarinus chinensis]
MGQVVIGVDPDSERHGYAVYLDGKLKVCTTATTVEIIVEHLPVWLEQGDVIFSIENVMANQFVYRRNKKQTKAAESKVAMSIGRCQNAQMELMRWLDHYGVPYVLYKPQRGNWADADNKPLFEKLTGWTGRSNADGRSAAFFGFLALRDGGKK